MKHYGDVSKIEGSQVEPVDIITFGSPCQDLSVAGKRAGIQDGERSNLFFEAVRIIKEMRKATNGEYPKYAVWENVFGAFSSNKGHDFHAVLEALCSVCDDTVSIPEPYDAKRTKLIWSKAGEVVGDNYSVAWRTLDAQYWGVPQRRKRIYLVADFGGQRAGEILFKPDSLRGNLPQSNEARQSASADAVGGIDGSVGVECIEETVDFGRTSDRIRINADKAATIQAGGGGSGAKTGLYCFPVIALQANGIDRADTAGCNGAGWRENESYTLNTVDRHAVCYDARGNGNGETVPTMTGDHQSRITDYTAVAVQKTLSGEDASGCLKARDYKGCEYLNETLSKCVIQQGKPPRKYIIRRLTPTECARLQGFPDKWGHLAPYNPADAEFWEDVRKTHAEINGKKYKPVKSLKAWYEKLHNDGAEYKAYGNGLALPCAEFVIRGIAEQGAKTLGSLFDGIGGFPLAGVMNGITPLWASEVEPYPIAVTVSRFGGTESI